MLGLEKFNSPEIAEALADQTDYEHHWLVDPLTGEYLSIGRLSSRQRGIRRFRDELHGEYPELLPS